jgi:hypothetical protein
MLFTEISQENSKVQVQVHLMTEGQSVSLSWYLTSIWDPPPSLLSLPKKLS